MTHSQNVPATTGPTTVSQDLLAAGMGALAVLGAGLLVLFGWAWLGFFGGLLGAGGAFATGAWWRNKHGVLFPKDLSGGAVGGAAALVALLTLFFFMAV